MPHKAGMTVEVWRLTRSPEFGLRAVLTVSTR
jgi:hypothetical protein